MAALTLRHRDYFLTDRHAVMVEQRHPQSAFPIHSHDFDELVVVWRGNGLHIWNDVPYRITCGDLFYIDACDRHGYESVNDLEMDNILFSRERLQLVTDWRALLPGSEMAQPQRYWRLSMLGMDVLRCKVDALAQESMKSDAISFQLSEALLLQLALLLQRFRHRPDSTALADAQQMDLLMLALRAGIAEPFSLDDFCQQHRLSPRRLRMLFKQQTGMSVSQYLRQLQLCTAMDMLRHGRSTIGDVAAASGFEDSNYFSVVFNRAVGESPREYRQRFR